ncbi:hypothetical protein V8C86DRAFT_2833540 [Haematococcus lacustris]
MSQGSPDNTRVSCDDEVEGLQPIEVHPTSWDPDRVTITLNVRLDACFVPSRDGGLRLDMAHVVVLDNFLDEATRAGLMAALSPPGCDPSMGPWPQLWERATADSEKAPRTWGLRGDALEALAASALPAKLEVQSRLQRLYPHCRIAHQPSHLMQATQQQGQGEGAAEASRTGASAPGSGGPPASSSVGGGPDSGADLEGGPQPAPGGGAGGSGGYDCSALLANAATAGDTFTWHQDADPNTLPVDCPFVATHGLYTNREEGRPLFVSLLLYLDEAWERDWAADTLFLDCASDTGLLVRPKKYRAVLMDQDVLHRLSPPSQAAGRPRYSLVWKLVFTSRVPGASCCIARPEWGEPVAFGSAAKAVRAVKELARKRMRDAR